MMLGIINYLLQKRKFKWKTWLGLQNLAISNLPTSLFAYSSKYFEVDPFTRSKYKVF